MQVSVIQVSKSMPFDNASNGFTATDAQAGIEEARNSATGKIRIPDNSGFDGTASTGRWLERIPNVASNVAPLVIPQARKLMNLTLTTDNVTSITVTVYKTPRGTPVSIATISIASGKVAYANSLNVSLVAGDEIGYQVTSGSGSKPGVTAEYESA